MRIDIREVESTKDGEVTSSRTLEESRIINRGITRARDIELEFLDCKQFLLSWIERQQLIYGCQMHLWDDDILRALADKQRNCMVTDRAGHRLDARGASGPPWPGGQVARRRGEVVSTHFLPP